MAKPSKTNIQPPTTPPKTFWDLDSDHNDAIYADNGSAAFLTLTGQINLTGTGINQSVLNEYDYVFFGVNGGVDETVIGRQELAGIIVTGNGKDTVTGGNWDDLVFAGNGSDTVHGGRGEDIIFGENGPDSLYGDANNDQIFGGNGPDKIVGGTDDGTFSRTVGTDALTLKQHLNDGHGNDIFTTDPAGTSTTAGTSDNTVRKEGVYVQVDANGHPLELTGSGDPVIHAVFSFSPSTTGEYTIGYYNANNLDTDGDPSPNVIHTGILTAGEKYFFTFTNADNDTVHVEVFSGNVTPPDPLSNNPNDPAPDPIASSQAVPLPPVNALFDHTHTDGSLSFVAGDILTGGSPDASRLPADPLSTTHTYDPNQKLGLSDGAPDTFVYNKVGSVYDGVDLITDYNQLEGDVVELHGINQASVRFIEETDSGGQHNLIVAFDDGSGGLVNNAAIKVLGAEHAADVTFFFT
jgi:hemolysin type calcium-binding protein